jgi:hypothetical protein
VRFHCTILHKKELAAMNFEGTYFGLLLLPLTIEKNVANYSICIYLLTRPQVV